MTIIKIWIITGEALELGKINLSGQNKTNKSWLQTIFQCKHVNFFREGRISNKKIIAIEVVLK